MFNWKYKIGEIKITDAQNNLSYSLAIGLVNRVNKEVGKKLYIRVFDFDNDFIFGAWVDDIEKEISWSAKKSIEEKRLSSEVLKQCIDYAKRIETMKVFS